MTAVQHAEGLGLPQRGHHKLIVAARVFHIPSCHDGEECDAFLHRPPLCAKS
jgi:hypothetical protein